LANDSNKDVYAQSNSSTTRAPRIVGLGLVSAASALAGGLAVAWWYRKTLTKLQNPIAAYGFERGESAAIDDAISDETDEPVERGAVRSVKSVETI
jgi:hypothetical protein